MMALDVQNLPELVKEVRRQLSVSQEEDLARELYISFATVNRWENGLVKPSKLAKAQLDNFCAKMTRQGKLKLACLPVRSPVRNARGGSTRPPTMTST